MSDPKLMPPRLRDWKKGVPQVGIFIRTAEGGVIQWVHDRATTADLEAALDIIRGGPRPPDVEHHEMAVREKEGVA